MHKKCFYKQVFFRKISNVEISDNIGILFGIFFGGVFKSHTMLATSFYLNHIKYAMLRVSGNYIRINNRHLENAL